MLSIRTLQRYLFGKEFSLNHRTLKCNKGLGNKYGKKFKWWEQSLSAQLLSWRTFFYVNMEDNTFVNHTYNHTSYLNPCPNDKF